MLLLKAEEGALWHLEEVDWTLEKAMQKWLGPQNEAGDLGPSSSSSSSSSSENVEKKIGTRGVLQ